MIEAHPFAGQLVDIRGASVGIAVATELEAHIFGHEKEDVRTRGWGRHEDENGRAMKIGQKNEPI